MNRASALPVTHYQPLARWQQHVSVIRPKLSPKAERGSTSALQGARPRGGHDWSATAPPPHARPPRGMSPWRPRLVSYSSASSQPALHGACPRGGHDWSATSPPPHARPPRGMPPWGPRLVSYRQASGNLFPNPGLQVAGLGRDIEEPCGPGLGSQPGKGLLHRIPLLQVDLRIGQPE